MYRGGQLRDISEVSELGVKTIRQFRQIIEAHSLSSRVLVPQLTIWRGSCKASDSQSDKDLMC